ncbi:BrnT family toxin [Ferrovum sp.]|uniref:BrnT family toxin n=1 Tax=Ferrovum sp. TaxID=2609467 RepID=UPI0026026C39|nr:BrnT family toxin [Ferrovum sp.]
MQIEFDPDKRARTLAERGLDFAHAGVVFAGRHLTDEDPREDYTEPRYITFGELYGRMVVIVWTPRGEARRIISMRKANEREQARYTRRVG